MDRKRRRNRAAPRVRAARPPCCEEWGGTCPQHQQQRRFDCDSRRELAAERREAVDGLFEILSVRKSVLHFALPMRVYPARWSQSFP